MSLDLSDIAAEEQKREEFRNLLFSLSKSQLTLKNKSSRARVYQQLERLYYLGGEERYRHFYSDIFSVLSQIKQDETSEGSIDILGQNLAEIRKCYQVRNHDEAGQLIDVSDSIRKLYDHVSLDIARMSYSDAGDARLANEERIASIQGKIPALEQGISEAKSGLYSLTKNVEEAEKVRQELAELKKDVEEAKQLKNDLSEARTQMENAQKEYISILGIFSSVVLAFIGGMTFSTSVLESMNQASIYRVVFITLLIGLVLINALFVLFYWIERMVHKAAKQSMTPMWIANGILLAALIANGLAWRFGLAEQRNSWIEHQYNFSVTSEETIEEDSSVQ